MLEGYIQVREGDVIETTSHWTSGKVSVELARVFLIVEKTLHHEILAGVTVNNQVLSGLGDSSTTFLVERSLVEDRKSAYIPSEENPEGEVLKETRRVVPNNQVPTNIEWSYDFKKVV